MLIWWEALRVVLTWGETDVPISWLLFNLLSILFYFTVLFHLQLSKAPNEQPHFTFCWGIWAANHSTPLSSTSADCFHLLWRKTRSRAIFHKYPNTGSIFIGADFLQAYVCACMLTLTQILSKRLPSESMTWCKKLLHTGIHWVSVLVSEGRQFVRILSVYSEKRDSINNVASWLRESTKSN